MGQDRLSSWREVVAVMAVAAALVVATLTVMAWGRVPPVLAVGCRLAVAGILGIATPAEVFRGLSNSGVRGTGTPPPPRRRGCQRPLAAPAGAPDTGEVEGGSP